MHQGKRSMSVLLQQRILKCELEACGNHNKEVTDALLQTGYKESLPGVFK